MLSAKPILPVINHAIIRVSMVPTIRRVIPLITLFSRLLLSEVDLRLIFVTEASSTFKKKLEIRRKYI